MKLEGIVAGVNKKAWAMASSRKAHVALHVLYYVHLDVPYVY